MAIDMDKPFAEFAEDHLKTPGGSNSALNDGLVGKQVVNALQLTYRKHCLADDSIGWIELEDILRDALCEVMGDREFRRWLDDVAD